MQLWLITTCALVALSPVAQAQTASLDVIVIASDSAPNDLRGAGVRSIELRNTATGHVVRARTNAEGRAHLAALPTNGTYIVKLDGIEQDTPLQLRANEAQTLTLRLPALQEVQVTARRNLISINATNAEVSASLPAAELQNLPVESRDVTRALIRLPNVVASTGFYPEAPSIAINGANGLFTQYLIDGLNNNENFLGGPKFPISTGSISDVSVLASSWSVEYGRTGNGVVNATSRGGSNRWAGEAFYLTRPGRPPDSASPYPGRDLSGNAVGEGFQRDQFGFGVGGPLRQDRTFLFVNAEYTRDHKDNLLSSPELGVLTTVPGRNRSLLLSSKLDHYLSEHWRLSLRANVGKQSYERQGGGLDGGVTFPSAGSVQNRDSALAALSAVFDNGRWSAQSQLAFSCFRWNYGQPLHGAGPQVTVLDPAGLTIAVVGDPGFVFDELERSVQWTEKVEFSRGIHAFKMGVDVLRSSFALAGGGNVNGNYQVQLTAAQLAGLRARGVDLALGPGDIPASAAVLDYAVELRPAQFGRNQNQYGVYAQDQIASGTSWTTTLGLRWDYDSLTQAGAAHGDRNNVAPRLALNWRASERLALRAGSGLFYARIPYTVTSDALQQNTTAAAFRDQLAALIAAGKLPASTNLSRVTFDGNLTVNPPCPAGYLQCPAAADVTALRDSAFSNERRILNPAGLTSPYTVQHSLGLQWQFSSALVGYADMILANGYHLLRLRDLNAPAPFMPNVAALTPANIALLRALPDNASRQALASQLGLIRTQAAADATRPVAVVAGGARQIVVSETEGRSIYRALNLTLEKQRRDDHYGFRITYTLSNLRNNTDDLNFRAADANDFTNEWGPSINDRRHVLNSVLYLYPSTPWTVSIAALLQSGQPINLIPDASIFGTTDLNGDGASFSTAYLGNSDRAPGVSRNSGRLPWATSVDIGLRYTQPLRLGGLEFSADVFNVFNARNLSGFANSATQSNQIQIAGTPFVERNAGPPRQFQFGLRYQF